MSTTSEEEETADGGVMLEGQHALAGIDRTHFQLAHRKAALPSAPAPSPCPAGTAVLATPHGMVATRRSDDL